MIELSCCKQIKRAKEGFESLQANHGLCSCENMASNPLGTLGSKSRCRLNLLLGGTLVCRLCILAFDCQDDLLEEA